MNGRALTALVLLLAPEAWTQTAGLSSATPDGPIAIRHARLVTVDGPVIEDGTLLMSEGKIAALGREVTIPEGAEVIDAGGQVIYPGLVDGLTTLGLTEISSVAGSVDTTETGDVSPQVRAWIAVHPHSDLIPVARANGVTATVTAPRGGLVSGQSALLRLAGSTPDELLVKQPLAMHIVYPTGRPAFDISRSFEEPELKTLEDRQKDRRKNQEKDLRRLAGLLEDAKALGEGLRASREGRLGVPRADLPEEALAPVARGEMPVVIRADAEEDIKGAVRFASEHGLKLILAGGLEAWRCLDELKKGDVPVLLKVERLPRRESDPYDVAFTNAAALQKAGVRFAIVSDDAAHVRDLPFEAAMARAFGLAPDAAIRAITLSPAEIFGVADRMGSLTVGKDANVVVATGDIMDHRTSVTHVFIDGREQSLETRHTHLWREFRERH